MVRAAHLHSTHQAIVGLGPHLQAWSLPARDVSLRSRASVFTRSTSTPVHNPGRASPRQHAVALLHSALALHTAGTHRRAPTQGSHATGALGQAKGGTCGVHMCQRASTCVTMRMSGIPPSPSKPYLICAPARWRCPPCGDKALPPAHILSSCLRHAAPCTDWQEGKLEGGERASLGLAGP